MQAASDVPCRGHGPHVCCASKEEHSLKMSSREVQSEQSKSLLACVSLSETATQTE